MGLSDCADPIDGDNSAIGSRRRACLYAMVQKAPESGKVDRPRVERVAAATHGGFRYLNDITNGKPLPSNLAW